jgi:hypothetical protein
MCSEMWSGNTVDVTTPRRRFRPAADRGMINAEALQGGVDAGTLNRLSVPLYDRALFGIMGWRIITPYLFALTGL